MADIRKAAENRKCANIWRSALVSSCNFMQERVGNMQVRWHRIDTAERIIVRPPFRAYAGAT